MKSVCRPLERDIKWRALYAGKSVVRKQKEMYIDHTYVMHLADPLHMQIKYKQVSSQLKTWVDNILVLCISLDTYEHTHIVFLFERIGYFNLRLL